MSFVSGFMLNIVLAVPGTPSDKKCFNKKNNKFRSSLIKLPFILLWSVISLILILEIGIIIFFMWFFLPKKEFKKLLEQVWIDRDSLSLMTA